MKPLVLLRSSSALRAAPVALLLVLAYYVTHPGDDLRADPMGYSASVVDWVVRNLLPVAFALASGLAAWEARKLANSAVWKLGAVRSRHTVAALHLLPVTLLSWATLVVPVVCALVQKRVGPDLPGLALLLFAMALCVAHAVIGFALGTAVPHLAVVPVVAVADFLAVGWSTGLTSRWPRHLTGLFAGKMMYGELPTATGSAAPLLLAGGIAVAAALLWAPGPRALWRLAACVLVPACAAVSYSLVAQWSDVSPRSTGHATLACAGASPRVCVPEVLAERLPALSGEAKATLATLREAGLHAEPVSLTDPALTMRYPRPSTEDEWIVPLVTGEATGTVRYQIARQAVRFPCASPATDPLRPAYHWVSSRVGEADAYLTRLSSEPEFTPAQRRHLQKQVADVLRLSGPRQVAWYEETLEAACRNGGKKA